MDATDPREKRALTIILFLSFVIVGAVVFVIYGFPARPSEGRPGVLPTLNAVLNGSAGVLLVLGYVLVRSGRVRAHRLAMLTAAVVSGAFLCTYLLHHASVGSVPFRGQGALRTLYFAILLPHVVLAAVIVPLSLLTLFRGLTGRVAEHRRVARVTLPLWLYVSVSGVAVYWLQYHAVP